MPDQDLRAPAARAPDAADAGGAPVESGRAVQSVPTDRNAPAAPAQRPPDVVYQLWFEQFKQINTLAVAATGGALILLQMEFARTTVVSGASVLSMAASVLVAMNGQNALVDEAAHGRPPGRGVRIARGVAGTLLAAGAGAFVSHGYFS